VRFRAAKNGFPDLYDPSTAQKSSRGCPTITATRVTFGTLLLVASGLTIYRVTRAVEESNRWMLRARDAMDRTYAQPLDVARLARIAHVSEAHFIRTFRGTFGETPHRYLQRRRVERAMFLLRETDRSVTDICFDVGFISLGTFSRTFHEIVGETPRGYRARSPCTAAPTCFTMAWTRPSSFGEAPAAGRPVASLSC
jgi:AraC-like DNA-binding protein